MLQTTLTVLRIALITVASARGLYDVYQVGAWGVNKVRGPKPLPQVVAQPAIAQPVAPAPAPAVVAQVVAQAPADAVPAQPAPA